MTYTAPATPIAGTAITVAFYGTNIRDNIIHLRGIIPDPGAPNRVLQSTSNTLAAFTATPSLTSLTLSGALSVGGNVGITGTLGFGGTMSAGGDINIATTKKLSFFNESAEKIVMDSSTSSIGTATNTVYIRTPVNMDFRDNGGTQRIQMVVSATPSMTIGGNTVLTSATPIPQTAADGYTGNGATSARQITVGFVPKIVWLWNEFTGSTMYIMLTVNGSIRFNASGNPTFSNAVHLHATDGFTVADGSVHGNDSGENYKWVALK